MAVRDGRRRRVVPVLCTLVLVALAGCSRSAGCDWDPCPAVGADRAGPVTATDPSGRVRWRTTIADLLDTSPFLSNGQLVVEGCHAPHLVDVTTGRVSTLGDLRHVVGVVGTNRKYAVGDDPDGGTVARPLDGGPGSLRTGGAPQSDPESSGFRRSLVVTGAAFVGVHGSELRVFSPVTGTWVDSSVTLPVGVWRATRLLALDDDHVVVPGSDGSVMGVDLAARAVTWRTLPTRPDLPTDLTVSRAGTSVVVVASHAPAGAPPAAAAPVTAESWTVDGLTGRQVGARTAVVPPTGGSDQGEIVTSLRDPATGWTLTQGLSRTPEGGCF